MDARFATGREIGGKKRVLRERKGVSTGERRGEIEDRSGGSEKRNERSREQEKKIFRRRDRVRVTTRDRS